jgi:outer membrane protein TolC
MTTQGYAMSLQEYLKIVEDKNRTVKSLDAEREAADYRQEAGDINLVPVLTAGVGYLSDKNPTSQFIAFGAEETKAWNMSLGLAKQFSSGTSVSVNATGTNEENPGLQGNPFFNNYASFGIASLGVSFSQSLWKDSFGHATRLRWQREEAATGAEKGGYDLQKKQTLVGAENSYWEYVYATENLKVIRDNLERAKKIEAWTRRRVNDGISERADLLQAQALVSQRQLLVVTGEDNLATATRQIRDAMELPDADPLPQITGDISAARPIRSMVDGNGKRVLLLDAYLASLQARAKELVARESEDHYRPDLSLVGSYNTNAFDQNLQEASARFTDTRNPTAKIGLNFTYQFDTDVKSAATNSYRKDALSAKLMSERKMLESNSAWTELNRQYGDLTSRIQLADQTAQLQTSRAKAQADLFNKGRSVTNYVVDAEQDAATSVLNLIRLKADQRKMEAQGRLYISLEE